MTKFLASLQSKLLQEMGDLLIYSITLIITWVSAETTKCKKEKLNVTL